MPFNVQGKLEICITRHQGIVGETQAHTCMLWPRKTRSYQKPSNTVAILLGRHLCCHAGNARHAGSKRERRQWRAGAAGVGLFLALKEGRVEVVRALLPHWVKKLYQHLARTRSTRYCACGFFIPLQYSTQVAPAGFSPAPLSVKGDARRVQGVRLLVKETARFSTCRASDLCMRRQEGIGENSLPHTGSNLPP